ncbi:MAG: PTS sugar transporter subunit IIB [candidate division Zixibacteria bacterium]|nr:PTS sugar transporter subunit IIB [candidate division Zixibacteria bacterium]
MKSIYYRVDEKFIHAQVIHGWLPYLKAKRIIGISSKIADDPLSKQIYMESLPEGVEGSIMKPEDAAQSKFTTSETERILVLFSSINDAVQFCEAGGDIKYLHLGGIYENPERTEYLSFIHLSDDEVMLLLKMKKKCGEIYCQDIPRAEPVSITELLNSNTN